MNPYDFIKNNKNNYLTLEDISKYKEGDIIVVIWDSNWEEYDWWENIKPGKYTPEDFFQSNRCKITINSPDKLQWNIDIFGKHPFHFNVEDYSKQNNMGTYRSWVELSDDGYIDIDCELLKTGKKIPKGWKAWYEHHSKFPKTTCIGWRGPIMLWNKLKESQDFIFTDKKPYGKKEEESQWKHINVENDVENSIK